MDIASSIQAVTEEVVLRLTRNIAEEDNIKKQEDMRKKIEEEFDENW